MTDPLAEYSLHIFGGFPEDTVIAVPNENGNPEVMAFIFDAEYDPFALKFGSDGGVSFETKNAAWIMLMPGQLRAVAKMCGAAEKLWAKLNAFYDAENDEWRGWHHLATVPVLPQNKLR